MNPHSPAQQLLIAIEAATTEWQFASALADYRAPRDERCGKRIQRDGMPSLRTLERCHDLPGRNNIWRWESGDESKFVNFTEQQLRAYLRLCKIIGELFESCIKHYQRIMRRNAANRTNGTTNVSELIAKDQMAQMLYWGILNILRYCEGYSAGRVEVQADYG